ncbi:MAG: sigma-54-dependent Fis family transcriptional regulator [Thermodesulfovibrionales bacterium]
MKKESEIACVNKQLSILYEIALTVGKSLDLKAILSDVLQKVISFMGVDAGVIYVISEETLEMIPVAFKNLSEEVVRDLCENRVKVGECMCGSIAQCNEEVIIRERASEDPRFTRAVLRKEGMEFYCGLPLRAKGKVVGVLCVINHTPYAPEPELLDILRAATQPIGLAIENALIFENVRREVSEKGRHFGFDEIITMSPSMTEVLRLVRKVLNVPASILICGESGTGKELIARAIHYNSIRAERPFIAINCGALPESLIESEMFGYIHGAFTGATTDKRGLLEAADGGTLFLDEVNSMSTQLQLKLLRFLQDRTFYKVGSTVPVTVDVRIIAATNQDIEEAVKTGTFREDLYYRLNVVKIDLPALKNRREDIPLLARYFIQKYSRAFGKSIRGLTDQALRILMDHAWPGNVRELENVIERAVIMAETHEILPEDLPSQRAAEFKRGTGWSLEEIEKEHIAKVLAFTKGEIKRAAELLGINPTTLWRKLKKMDNKKDQSP